MQKMICNASEEYKDWHMALFVCMVDIHTRLEVTPTLKSRLFVEDKLCTFLEHIH